MEFIVVSPSWSAFSNIFHITIDIVCDTQYNVINSNVEGSDAMNYDEIVSGYILELRRGTLVLLVLSQLKKAMYGYNLVKILEECNIPIEANTLYPLMRRLETQGLLKSEWETGGSKPRKYYVITEDGKIVLERMKKHWNSFSDNVNLLLEDNGNEK